MKRIHLPLLLLVLASLACDLVQVVPTAAPTTAPPAATDTPASPTRTPRGTATRAATATLVPSLTPRPATPTRAPGTYYNDVLGVSLTYPPEWDSQEGGDAPAVLLTMLDMRNQLMALLLQVPVEPGQSLEDAGAALATELGGAGVTVLAEQSVVLADGTPAYEVVMEEEQQDTPVRMKLVLALRGARGFAVVLATTAAGFEAQADTIDEVAYSLHLDAPRPYGISRESALVLAGSEPLTLDPARTLGSAGDYVGLIFSGLVALDTRLQVVPDLAERWELSSDARTYTFYLRRDVTFHDGKAFTAADVKYSLERAADPKTGSNTAATYLGDIVGVKDKLDGKTEDVAGVKVIDDHTVAITIDEPKVYFLAKLAYPTSWIVDQADVESGLRWEEHPNGTGPFRLAAWEHNRVLIFERNAGYRRNPVKLEHVLFLLYAGVPLQMYEVGDIDMTGVGGDSLERVLDPAEPLSRDLISGPAFCTMRIVFDAAQKPFDDPKVRQAFIQAVDRDQLIETVAGKNVKRTDGILPPGMPGYVGDIRAPAFGIAAARQALSDSSYGSAAGLPEITFTVRGLGGAPSALTAALVDTWQKNLGVTLNVEQVDPENYEDVIYGDHGQIVDYGWCADYPDPENFLDVLYHTGSRNNVGHYSDPQADALLEQARSERDVAKRLGFYHQVEQMLVDGGGALLLWNYTQYSLVQTYVKGYVLTPIEVAQFQNVWLERP